MKDFRNQDERGKYPLTEFVQNQEGSIVIPFEKEATQLPKLYEIEYGNQRRNQVARDLNKELDAFQM